MTAYMRGQESVWTSLGVALAIGLGAVAQAALGRALIQHFAGFPTESARSSTRS